MTARAQELAFWQLATMLGGNLALVAAIRTCAEQFTGRTAREWLRIAERIERGEMFSTALVHERGFDPYVVALVEVGETTGELARTLTSAADFLRRRREHRAMLLNALFYPAVVVLATVGVVWFMLVRVIPTLKEFLAGEHRRLPELTEMLMRASDFLVANAPAVVTVLGAVLMAVWLARRQAAVRAAMDAAVFRLPVAGAVCRLSATAVFARSLAILVDSGITLLAALEIVEGLFANRHLRQLVSGMRRDIIRGSSLAGCLKPRREFAPMLARMVAVGELSGSLAAVLKEVADFHEARLAAVIRRFGAVMEPVLIVTVGSIVGFVYIAFFLAVFALSGGR